MNITIFLMGLIFTALAIVELFIPNATTRIVLEYVPDYKWRKDATLILRIILHLVIGVCLMIVSF